MGKKDKKAKKKVKKERVFRKVALKKKKRKWYPIFSNKEFSGIQIGELLAPSLNDLLGRIIKINLSAVTGQARRQSVRIKFRIKEVKEEKPICEILGYELVESFVKRAVRKGKSKIDVTMYLKSKDNYDVTTKVLVITRNKVQGKVSSAIGKKVREFFVEKLKKSDYDDIIKGLLNEELNKEFKRDVNKVYPVSVAKVRYFVRK